MTDDCPAVFLGSLSLRSSTRVSTFTIKSFPVPSAPMFEQLRMLLRSASCLPITLQSFIASPSKTKYLIQLQALNLVSQRGGPYLLLENGTFISLSKSKISTVTLTYPVLLSGSQFVQWFMLHRGAD
jgi:hypothetical protein